MKRLLFVLALFSGTLAWGHKVRDLDITVELARDGSARVIQCWNVEAGSNGTEWFIPVSNLGPMTIGDLQVYEGGAAYENLGDSWDVDRSRSWKERKCGIVRKADGGAELCWGLGAASKHLWETRFRLTGLVQSYDDADAFNFMFVNPGMNEPPQHVRLTIVPAFDCPGWTYDNTRVWAFGFDGEINVLGGKVVAETHTAFGSKSKMIAMVRFEKGLFEPAVVVGGPVQPLIDRALKGSSYGQEEEEEIGRFGKIMLGFVALLFLGGAAFLFYLIGALILGYRYSRKIYGQHKIDSWSSEVPLDGNLLAAEYLLVKGERFGSVFSPEHIIGAYFLRWVMEGKLRVEPDNKDLKRVNLLFLSESIEADPLEAELYEMARAASGDNLLLEKGEFEKWSKKNYKKMTGWPDRAVEQGKEWFRKKGYFVKDGECTPEGAARARGLIEYRNYLKEFVRGAGRSGVADVARLKDALVYAQFFGMAKDAAKQMQKLYPSQYAMMANELGMNDRMFLYWILWNHRMSTRSFAQAAAKAGSASGTGGHASFGGGGGFSGGGFGGGGR